MTVSTKTIELKDVMARAWGINSDDIPADAELNGFPQWDSLGHVSLLVELEKEYGIAIDYDVLTELTSISAITGYLSEKND